jgi:hypothetical protein
MSEINRSLNLLYPPFKDILLKGLEKAHASGLMAYVFEGFRTNDRQGDLYARGRTNTQAIVTWVLPGYSLHNYGLAADIVFDKEPLKEGYQWTWEGGYSDKNGDNYDKLAKILKDAGLEWLGDSTSDRAHFQKTWGIKIKQLKQIADVKGVIGVWLELDKILEGIS